MLVVAAKQGLIPFALSMKNGMAERRRLDPSIRGRVAVQHVIAELLPDRPAVFKGWIHRLIRSTEHLQGAESRLCPALGRDIDERRRLVSDVRLHPAEHDVGPFPSPRCNHIGKCGRNSVRDRHPVDSQLHIGVILPDVHLFEGPVSGAGNRQQHIVQFVVVSPRQRFDVFSADRIGLARSLVLNGRQRRHHFQGNLFGLRERERDRPGKISPQNQDNVLTPIRLLNRTDRIGAACRNSNGKLPGIVGHPRGDGFSFLIFHLHQGLRHPPKVLVLNRADDRIPSIPFSRLNRRAQTRPRDQRSDQNPLNRIHIFSNGTCHRIPLHPVTPGNGNTMRRRTCPHRMPVTSDYWLGG